MSDPIEQPDPIWRALHHAHSWCDLSERDQDEPPTGHHATPREGLLDGSPDLRSDDTNGLKAALTQVFGQPVRLEGLLPNAQDTVGGYLNAARARELATVLLAGAEVIDGPGQSPLEINKYGWGMPRPACVDCGQAFHPDSSPHMDRCWVCAERDDEESGQ